jgi:hypothetical protein
LPLTIRDDHVVDVRLLGRFDEQLLQIKDILMLSDLSRQALQSRFKGLDQRRALLDKQRHRLIFLQLGLHETHQGENDGKDGDGTYGGPDGNVKADFFLPFFFHFIRSPVFFLDITGSPGYANWIPIIHTIPLKGKSYLAIL